MKKIICIAALCLCTSLVARSQDYNWAIGVRAGGEMTGVSAKYKWNARHAVEGIVGFPYKNGVLVTGLYQWNIPVWTSGFNILYGAGMHIGSYRNDFCIGVDVMIGAEYTFPAIPLSLSLDYKPMLNFAPNVKLRGPDIALGVRFAF